MTPSRSLLPAFIFAAVGVLGLNACSGEKPSGIAPFTPTASTTTASSSPTVASKWTPEQQRVIDGYDRFNLLVNGFWDKSQKIDMKKIHRTAQEPFASAAARDLGAALAAGFIRSGAPRSNAESVTVTGRNATLRTCLDLSRTKLTNPGAGSRSVIETPPPSVVTVSLIRSASSWLVSDLKQGKAACAGH